MVFYFTASDGTVIYMGKDKFENERLIKHGWPEDVWFHVDSLSSAHVYLRLTDGKTIDDITPTALEECSQLVKANSIQGSKLRSVDVVYTPWANLQKSDDMAPGQVGYHDRSAVRKYVVEKKDRDVLKRLARTKEEKYPDLPDERAARDAREARRNMDAKRKKRKEEEALAKERMKEKELRSYKTLFEGEGAGAGSGAGLADFELDATEDSSAAVAYEDDFM